MDAAPEIPEAAKGAVRKRVAGFGLNDLRVAQLGDRITGLEQRFTRVEGDLTSIAGMVRQIEQATHTANAVMAARPSSPNLDRILSLAVKIGAVVGMLVAAIIYVVTAATSSDQAVLRLRMDQHEKALERIIEFNYSARQTRNPSQFQTYTTPYVAEPR